MTKRGTRNQKVTLQDVADAAGVSKATASLALRNHARISEPTRQRIREAVAALGYVYNQRAASLRTQRSFTIGLILKDVSNPFNAELTAGAEAALAKMDYSLLLGTSDDDLHKQASMVRTMLERDIDGLILSPTAATMMDSLEKLQRFLPLVLTTQYYPNLAADSVGMDNEMGTVQAVEHLIRRGHRRIAFIGGYDAALTRQWRLQSYRETLQRHDIEFDPGLCIRCPVTRRGGYDAVHKLLSMPEPPAAAYCFSDVIAFGVMLGLRAAGLDAGADFAVVGFDDVPEASLWHPSLTTIATDPMGMGQKAAQLMLQRIAQPELPVQRVIMPSRLIQRDSTAMSPSLQPS